MPGDVSLGSGSRRCPAAGSSGASVRAGVARCCASAWPEPARTGAARPASGLATCCITSPPLRGLASARRRQWAWLVITALHGAIHRRSIGVLFPRIQVVLGALQRPVITALEPRRSGLPQRAGTGSWSVWVRNPGWLRLLGRSGSLLSRRISGAASLAPPGWRPQRLSAAELGALAAAKQGRPQAPAEINDESQIPFELGLRSGSVSTRAATWPGKPCKLATLRRRKQQLRRCSWCPDQAAALQGLALDRNPASRPPTATAGRITPASGCRPVRISPRA